MPYQVTFDSFPSGIALTAAKKGGKVKVGIMGFSSSEDGDKFIKQLEGFPNVVLNRLPSSARITASTIDHLLAVIRKDKTATIYVNEIDFLLRIRSKKSVKKGGTIYQDDIADIERLELGNIQIANDAAIIFVFSIGWRKGLFFDVGPLQSEPILRKYNLESLLGSYYSYLSFQHLFKITEEEWQCLFDQQWFPFITLKSSTVQAMLAYMRNRWQVDDLLNKIADEASQSLPIMLERWKGNSFLQPHFELIKYAADRYIEKDYVSATAILYTRIEGVMRGVHRETGTKEKASPKNLAKSVTDYQRSISFRNSLLLPPMFQRYLEEVYFKNFEPDRPAKLSRYSVAHGTAIPSDFSLKAATIGLLIIDQIFFFLPPGATRMTAQK